MADMLLGQMPGKIRLTDHPDEAVIGDGRGVPDAVILASSAAPGWCQLLV
ncbi:hypothetical protein ACGFX2_34660 [Streptomyces goshikiensis]